MKLFADYNNCSLSKEKRKFKEKTNKIVIVLRPIKQDEKIIKKHKITTLLGFITDDMYAYHK